MLLCHSNRMEWDVANGVRLLPQMRHKKEGKTCPLKTCHLHYSCQLYYDTNHANFSVNKWATINNLGWLTKTMGFLSDLEFYICYTRAEPESTPKLFIDIS